MNTPELIIVMHYEGKNLYMYMYTCVLREETNRYAARYYSTFNISGVAPSSFPSFVPSLCFLLSLLYFLFFSFLSFFLFFFLFSFKPTLFGELIALRRSSLLSSSPENDHLESENDDPREISNAREKKKKKKGTPSYIYDALVSDEICIVVRLNVTHLLRSVLNATARIRFACDLEKASIEKGSCSLY